MRRLVRAALAVLSSTALAVTAAPAAAAPKPKPKLTFTIAAHVETAARIPFSYTGKSLPAGAHLVVQRQVGTGAAWKTIAKLHGAKGKATLAPLPVGKRLLRLVLLDEHNKGLTSAKRLVVVFGHVPLGSMIQYEQAPQTGSVLVGAYTFPYVATTQGPGPERTLWSDASTCRSMHFDLASSHDNPSQTSEAWQVSLTQESKDPVTATIAPDQIGSLDAVIVLGQPWSLTVAAPGETSSNAVRLAVNGWGDCYEAGTVTDPY
jgi:hypothetical protein